MPRALVLNPWVTDFKLYDEWMHPLGLCFLISLLRHNGWETEFINCLERGARTKDKRFATGGFESVELRKPAPYKRIPRKYKRYGISERELEGRLDKAARPDIVLLGSAMTYWIQGLAQTAAALRRAFPATPIVIGGIAATLMPEAVEKCVPAALVHRGGILDSCESLAQMHPLLGGLTTQGWQPDMRASFAQSSYLRHGPVLLSLGCPLRCSYCASSLLQPSFRFRPADLVLDEIAWLADNRHARDFAFYDDALLYRAGKGFLPFARKLAKRDLHVRLHAPNGLHVRWLTAEVLDAMREAGFVTLRLGYESGLEKHRCDTASKAGRKELAHRVALVRKAGFAPGETGVYVMGGLPQQKLADMLAEMDFVASLGAMVKPVLLSPVPRTRLFEYYAASMPDLTVEPLSHNDTYFVTRLEGWGWEAVDTIRDSARTLNASFK